MNERGFTEVEDVQVTQTEPADLAMSAMATEVQIEPVRTRPIQPARRPRGRSAEANSMQAYYRDISEYSLLTAEQEVELATTMREAEVRGEELRETGQASRRADKALFRAADQARELFINSNLRLVVSIAKK